MDFTKTELAVIWSALGIAAEALTENDPNDVDTSPKHKAADVKQADVMLSLARRITPFA